LKEKKIPELNQTIEGFSDSGCGFVLDLLLPPQIRSTQLRRFFSVFFSVFHFTFGMDFGWLCLASAFVLVHFCSGLMLILMMICGCIC
jgi:hypothetical protein